MLKYAGTTIHTSLDMILQTIWNTEKLPEEWTTAIINPLHKRVLYRGISILDCTVCIQDFLKDIVQ